MLRTTAVILNVDADEVSRVALTAVLQKAGFLVREAGTAAAALAGAADQPDAILLGFHLPDAVGAEVCRRLKADPSTRPIPVLLLSGDSKDSPCRIACFEAGAEACIARPVAADELIAQIKTLVRLRRLEQNLRASERRFKTLAENAPVGIFETDAAGNGLFVNDRWCMIAGMTPDAAKGQGWVSALHPEDRDRIFHEWYTAARDGREFTSEYRFRTPEGHVTWLSGNAVTVRDEAGTISGYIGTVTDITESKRADEALRESEQRLRAISNNVPNGAVYQVVGDADGHRRFLYLSAGVEALLGVTTAEALTDATTLYRLVHEDDRPRLAAQEDAALRNLAAFDCEFRSWTRTGVLRWLHCRSAPRRIPSGETVWEGIIMDVTDRKQAEEQVRRLNDQLQERVDELQTLLDILPVGVWQADPACERIIGNRPAYAMVGLPQGMNASLTAPEVRAGSKPGFKCLVDGQEVPADDLPMQRAARTGEMVLNEEHDIVLDDGTMKTMLCNVAPILGGDGRVRAVLGAYADITDRKRAEVALRQSEARLAVELGAMQRLHELSTRLLAAPDLRTALAEILDAAITMSRADLGTVQLYDPQAGTLQIVAHRGFGPDFLDHFRTVRGDQASACSRAMRGERVIIEDVQTDPIFAPHRQAAATAGYRAVQSTPLVSRSSKLLGILSTHFRQPHRPSEHDLRMLDLYARQAADLIDRIRNDEALHRVSERLTSLVNNTPLGVVEWDKDFQITRWSRGRERVRLDRRRNGR